MALTVPLIVLAVLLSLMESPASAPVHRVRPSWAPAHLEPALSLPSQEEGGGKGKTALGILDLWKAIDGLPYPQSQLASKRSLGETFAKPDSGVTFVGVPDVVPWKRIRPGTTRFQVRSLALLSGLRIQCCCELWCRLQMWLGAHIAVAVV
uniref:Uncharacterized protein n=1 Tax=Sus scrofa TaxID=9823 RepID=A0A8D1HXE7_PIG